MTNSAEQLSGPLRIESDPFASSAAGPDLGGQLQIAFHEIIPKIILHTRIVLVTGSARTGKTQLADMIARTCPDMGLSVLRVDRGDLMQITLGKQPDVLLIDNANSIADSMLEVFSRENEKRIAATTVFFGLPSCAARFISANVDPVIVQLAPLFSSDARSYLLERAYGAGLPDLFTNEALELIVNRSHGSPRSLRSLASVAFLGAATEGASKISLKHAAGAFAAELPSGGLNTDGPALGHPDAAPTKSEASNGVSFAAQQPAENLQVASRICELPKEGQEPPVSPLGTKTLTESIGVRRADETPVGHPMHDELAVKSKMGRKALVAGIVIVIAAAASVVTLMPSMLASAGLSSAAPVPDQPAPARASIIAPAAPQLPTIFEPEPVQIAPAPPAHSEAENVAPAETSTDARPKAGKRAVTETAEAKLSGQAPLTPEEEAAVQRGIREMERSAPAAVPLVSQ